MCDRRCCVFQSWSGPEKLLALDELIDSCEPTQVKHMMQVIEPQFQRDFISLLPKEVRTLSRSLSFLFPRPLPPLQTPLITSTSA
jgi:F-box/WD-40 domain protein 7